MLEASDVCVAWGRRPILEGVSLRLKPGRITVVIGPNGAGKSTVLACCSGALTPAHGTIRLAGECLHQLSAAELGRRRAVLEQSPMALAGFTLNALVGLGIPRQVSPRQTQSLVGRALTAVTWLSIPIRRLTPYRAVGNSGSNWPASWPNSGWGRPWVGEAGCFWTSPQPTWT